MFYAAVLALLIIIMWAFTADGSASGRFLREDDDGDDLVVHMADAAPPAGGPTVVNNLHTINIAEQLQKRPRRPALRQRAGVGDPPGHLDGIKKPKRAVAFNTTVAKRFLDREDIPVDFHGRLDRKIPWDARAIAASASLGSLS